MAEDPVESSPRHTRAMPLHDEIAKRAYDLWKSAGQPEGRSEEFWLNAEKQILGADGQVRNIDGAAVSAEQYAESTDANHAKAESGAKR
jgi:hypothetical protein